MDLHACDHGIVGCGWVHGEGDEPLNVVRDGLVDRQVDGQVGRQVGGQAGTQMKRVVSHKLCALMS